MFGLFAEGKLIDEGLGRLLVLLSELGVEVQLFSLVVEFAIHQLLFIINKARSEAMRRNIAYFMMERWE